MAIEFTKKQLKLIEEYKDFINNPMSDGYTVVYLEGKYKTTIEEMKKLYEKYEKAILPQMDLDELLDKLIKEINTYHTKLSYGCCVSFPKESVERIIGRIEKVRNKK